MLSLRLPIGFQSSASAKDFGQALARGVLRRLAARDSMESFAWSSATVSGQRSVSKISCLRLG